MDLNAANALDRTALLLATDIFNGRVTKDDVVAGLLATTAEVTATEQELANPAAQHAVVTLVLQLAMSGIGIDLDIPDVELRGPQPPLRGSSLRAGLLEHVRATLPWVTLGTSERSDIRFVIGDGTPDRPDDIMVTGTPGHVRVGPAAAVPPMPWRGDWPVSPIGAALAAAALAVRAAAIRMTRDAAIGEPLLATGPLVTDLTIDTTPIRGPDVGHAPVISAGAITHGLLHTLLRVADLRGTLEVFDDDHYDTPNLNRYPLLIVDDLGVGKAPALERWSSANLRILGRDRRYAGGDGAGAQRMLVGADDIAVRWTVQRDVEGWLGIGATSHLFAEVSTHLPGTPCSGCVHDHDDDAPETIPTISVISGWAGLMLANELLRSLAGDHAARLLWSYPLGLGGPHGHSILRPRANPGCAIRCAPSRRIA
jgi:hypothetical protein